MDLLKGRNPVACYTGYKRSKAMSIVHDWFNWLGSYTFEAAKPEEVFKFYQDRRFVLKKLTTTGGGLGNHQFVFAKR